MIYMYIITSSEHILCRQVRLIVVWLQREASHTHPRAHQTRGEPSFHIHSISYFCREEECICLEVHLVRGVHEGGY